MSLKSSVKICVHCGLIVFALSLSGCAQIELFRENPWMTQVMHHAPGLMWSITKWCILYAVVAIPVALLAFFGLLRIGALRWEWKYAGYLRMLTGGVFLLITVALGVFAGFGEGLYRSLQVVIDSPELKKELGPLISSGSDIVGATYSVVVRTPTKELTAVLAAASDSAKSDQTSQKAAMELIESRIDSDLEDFRAGEWEIDVDLLNQRLVEVKDDTVAAILPIIKQAILEDFPALTQGKDAKLFDWFFTAFGEKLLVSAVTQKIEQSGLQDPIVIIWKGLAGAALESGNPKTLSHSELSGYLSSRILYATLVYPTKVLVHGNSISLLLFWFAMIFAIVILFRGLEIRRLQSLPRLDPVAPSSV